MASWLPPRFKAQPGLSHPSIPPTSLAAKQDAKAAEQQFPTNGGEQLAPSEVRQLRKKRLKAQPLHSTARMQSYQHQGCGYSQSSAAPHHNPWVQAPHSHIQPRELGASAADVPGCTLSTKPSCTVPVCTEPGAAAGRERLSEAGKSHSSLGTRLNVTAISHFTHREGGEKH